MSLRKKLFITPTLATVIGSFVLVTAAVILIIQAVTSETVIRQLGGTLVDMGMESSEIAFTEQLHAVTETGQYTQASWARNELSFDDPDLLVTYLYGALAPMDRVSFLVLVDETGAGVDVDRGEADGQLLGGDVTLASDIPSLMPLAEEAAKRTDPFWSDALYMPSREHTYFVYTHPLYEGDDYRGSLLIGMSLERISDITWHISTDDIIVFLMKEGSHQVIAHPTLHDKFDDLSSETPLLHVNQIADAFLAEFADMPRLKSSTFDIADGLHLHAGHDQDGYKRFVIIEERNENLMGMPARIGVHFPAEYLDQPLHQLMSAIVVGTVLLFLSLIGAIYLARRIARPVQRASVAAQEVAKLNLDAVEPLPSSVIRELDDLSKGFNAMVGGLTAFNRYVPRTLVQKLLSEGRADAPPEEREVAVLFTDIAGYTAASEGMSASQTAAFVNHHLSLLGAEITKRDGTIDKYIGDSVMAFWGAPDHLDNPAEHAAQAALGMAAAIHADNQKRQANGDKPVRIRVGLHLGPLVVGDIGAPGRVNYTVIGDTVNAASRLESLGKEIDPDAEVVILASEDIARHLSNDIECRPIGPQKVKGRAEPLQVVRLLA
ncbi:MAG: adenylate/guanylate cyclase domain-containing protein [Roseibium sp.]|uniref:adenylate/guanylate cyclase domain-containing protein n=1 Tax=Roseibium sp. TaxID=1936156 RepID=UPI0026247C4C|nr:adenylate/guanylate cyclase domain-containing protein [Roseibium sp.]MCV0428464.1 adenylate/guanylate cyclase domain-containing protein [Roseibium sp.]